MSLETLDFGLIGRVCLESHAGETPALPRCAILKTYVTYEYGAYPLPVHYRYNYLGYSPPSYVIDQLDAYIYET